MAIRSCAGMTNLFIIMILFILHTKASVMGRKVPYSVEVVECPIGEKAWKERVLDRRCDSGLSYHCVKNQANKLIEACLKRKKVSPGKGGCPWVLVKSDGRVIFGAVHTVCDDWNSCPTSNHTGFYTDQLYKYPGCIRSKYTSIVSTTPNIESTQGMDTDDTFLKEKIPYYIQLVSAIFFTISFVVQYIRLRCKKKKPSVKCKSGSSDSHQQWECYTMVGPELGRGEELQTEGETGLMLDKRTSTQVPSCLKFLPQLKGICMVVSLIAMTTLLACTMYLTTNISSERKNLLIVNEIVLWLYLIIGSIVLIYFLFPVPEKRVAPTCTVKLTFVLLHIIIMSYVLSRLVNTVIYFTKCGNIDFLCYMISSIFIIYFLICQSHFHWQYLVLRRKFTNTSFSCICFVACTNTILGFYSIISDVQIAEQFDSSVYDCVVGNNLNEKVSGRFYGNTFPTFLAFIPEYSFLSIFLTSYVLYFSGSRLNNSFVNDRSKLHMKRSCISSTYTYVTITMLIIILPTTIHSSLNCFLQLDPFHKSIVDTSLHVIYLVELFIILLALERCFSCIFISLEDFDMMDVLIMVFYIGVNMTHSFQLTISVYSAIEKFEVEISIGESIFCTVSLVTLSVQTLIYLIFSTISKDRNLSLNKSSKYNLFKWEMSKAIFCLVYFNAYVFLLDSSKVSVVPSGVKIPAKLLQRSLMQFMISMGNMYRFLMVTSLLVIIYKIYFANNNRNPKVSNQKTEDTFEDSSV